eukprot:946850_1
MDRYHSRVILLVFFVLIIGICELNIFLPKRPYLAAIKLTPVPLSSQSNAVQPVLNHYADYMDSKPLYLGACGAPRTGSTMLYNTIRILVHDKIDPDLWAGYSMGKPWTRFLDERFPVVHKTHGSCDNLEQNLHQKQWWNRRNVTFYTSWRDVKDTLCSMIKFEEKITNETLVNRCESYTDAYHSCNSDKYKNIRVFDMSFDELIRNKTNVIEVAMQPPSSP